jgi:hypothetical protein
VVVCKGLAVLLASSVHLGELDVDEITIVMFQTLLQ